MVAFWGFDFDFGVEIFGRKAQLIRTFNLSDVEVGDFV
jgi:hypothetical protein